MLQQKPEKEKEITLEHSYLGMSQYEFSLSDYPFQHLTIEREKLT